MNNKITVPKNVAEAIRHYTDLADTKSEAFTDILSLGYEAERSEIILRHFDHDYDELMEALICGYEVADQ
jgi:DNA integrity scanning protein DisA with diadenylate cyclase activity